jgi:hypothetical protein
VLVLCWFRFFWSAGICAYSVLGFRVQSLGFSGLALVTLLVPIALVRAHARAPFQGSGFRVRV